MISDPSLLNGHEYIIVKDFDTTAGAFWFLKDLTLDAIVLDTQYYDSTTSPSDPIDGFSIGFYNNPPLIENFECIANAAGPIDPPEAAAAWFADFPVPTVVDPDGYVTDNQQVGSGHWMIHTADNGGTCDAGTRGSYDAFLDRTTRYSANFDLIDGYNFEMRFTGSYDNPGVNGSYTVEWYEDENVFWVPFELWRSSSDTPDDPSDDLRLIPLIIDDGGDNTFNLESWGCFLDTHGGDGEHSVSPDDDDPFTDWVYWRLPIDTTPGETGYLAAEAEMLGRTFGLEDFRAEIWARMVLVNWNGGLQPPFNQDIPEQGTIFRIRGAATPPVDTNYFAAVLPSENISSGPDGLSIYTSYKILNKGGNQIDSCYIMLWSDPDLGGSGDDKVGCDSISQIAFSYNGDNYDSDYGSFCPSIGFKAIYGPLVPSPGDVAVFDDQQVNNFKNMKMSSFVPYLNGLDPDNALEVFYAMKGYDNKNQIPYTYMVNPTTFWYSGDPVTGTGDLDPTTYDKRMAFSLGPFTFAPGDSQYVLIKMTVGQGHDRLSSITNMKQILNLPLQIPTGVNNNTSAELPATFELTQNYPNPFNPVTTIRYSLPVKSKVTLEIFNVLGQKVKTIVNKEQSAGNYSVEWNGTNQNGDVVSTGIYMYKLTAGDFVRTKKMILLK